MNRTEEFAAKRERIGTLIERRGLAGLVLGRVSSVAWAGCGADSHVVLASDQSFGTLLFTPKQDYLLADSIELPRLLAEEFGDLPLEPVEYPWYEPWRLGELLSRLAPGKLGGDIDLAEVQDLRAELSALRQQLLPAEHARYRELAAATGEAISTACGEVTPGMSEKAIAGVLSEECYLRGLTPAVVLVAVDERIKLFRHPIPTEHKLTCGALLVLGARRHGLIAAVTRMLHFGALPDELRRRMHACARIHAAAINATRPGVAVQEIFATITAAYAAEGFADEWKLHHQGGPIGYAGREYLATPARDELVQDGQVFAWNPSLAGVKSEDTFLIGADGPELLTTSSGWPMIEVTLDGRTHHCAAILELEIKH